MKARWKELELDEKIVTHSNNVVTKALQQNKHLQRKQLHDLLQEQKIKTDENRLSHLLMAAELDGLICSGPREGKQFTYALLDERAAPTKALTIEEALSKLAAVYFTSRGPATNQDFVWWSGLTVGDCKAAVATLSKKFFRENVDGNEYIFAEANAEPKGNFISTFLMPAYDEYGVAYRNREALNPNNVKGITRDGSPIFENMLVADGIIAGNWQRVTKGKKTDVVVTPHKSLSKTKQKEVDDAVKRYKKFIGSVEK